MGVFDTDTFEYTAGDLFHGIVDCRWPSVYNEEAKQKINNIMHGAPDLFTKWRFRSLCGFIERQEGVEWCNCCRKTIRFLYGNSIDNYRALIVNVSIMINMRSMVYHITFIPRSKWPDESLIHNIKIVD